MHTIMLIVQYTNPNFILFSTSTWYWRTVESLVYAILKISAHDLTGKTPKKLGMCPKPNSEFGKAWKMHSTEALKWHG